MNPGMAGDDAALDPHVAAIAAKLRGGAAEERPDTRENREDRDATDVSPTDLEELERMEREGQATQEQGESQKADATDEGAEKAEDEADAFIELPPAEDGGEPERVPVTEALEAVKQLRQMNGDIATAVIKAEEDAFAKQDQITQALNQTFDQVAKQARIALQSMHAYAPQPPDPIMLDRNAGYYDPEGYHTAKIAYDAFVAHYNNVAATLQQAEKGQGAVNTQQGAEYERREIDRASRFIPEFKAEDTRKARKAEILQALQPYGVTQAELDEIVDHKAWRMMNDLAKLKAAEKKAPEVKKHLQETKPKIVNGRAPQTRDPRSGQFTAQADKELREKGTEEAFVKKLMRSGALKQF